MIDVMDRQQTTMSDSDVVHKVRPRQAASGLMSDDDIVHVSRSFSRVPSASSYEWPASFETMQRASALEQLKHQLFLITDNWDGYYAKAPQTNAIEATVDLLNILFEALPSMPFPDVGPGTEGNVVVEWDSRDTDIVLIIEPTYQIEASVRLEETEYDGPLESVRGALTSALARIASGS
ncbi:MAG: hypothetical protein OXH78_04185 [Acidimicrobiaceae bacterium]|nr:hypothetical protein [Acidimicrobiaceae bacterium]